MAKPILALVVALYSGAHYQEHPFAVVFDSHLLEPTARIESLQLRWDFDKVLGGSRASLSGGDTVDVLPKHFRSLWQIGEQAKFRFVSGRAHYFDRATGKFRHVRFVTTPSKAGFDAFVQSECDRRSAFQINGSDSRFRITSPPEPATSDRPAITWHDAFFNYQKGVFAFGDESVLKADLKPLVPLARKAEGKDWLMLVQPQYASADARRAFLKRYVPRWSMMMQQRDGEADRSHQARRGEFGLYRAILEGLVEDAESLLWAIRSPRAKSGYEVDFSVAFKKGSESARVIESLRPRNDRIFAHDNNAILSVASCVALPEVAREFMRASSEVSEDKLLKSVLAGLSGADVLRARVKVAAEEEHGEFIVVGELPWSPDQPLSEPGAVLDAVSVTANRMAFPVAVGQKANSYKGVAKLKNNRSMCEFSISARPEEAKLPRQFGSKRRLFSVRVDLSSLAKSSDTSNDAMQILEWLEKRYHTDITSLEGVDWVKPIPQTMVSVLSMLEGPGDWTAAFDVDLVGTRGLRMRLRVGRELYGLIDARKRHSREARRRSLGG